MYKRQQEAQRDFQVGKQLHHDGIAVGAAEGADDGGDGRQGLAALHKIAAAADVERVDDKECPAKRGNRADEHTDEDRPQHTVGAVSYTHLDVYKRQARAYDRILRVARTVADLDGSEVLDTAHLSETLQYRTLDRKFGM